MQMLRKRWISIFVENEIGVLARISGLFSSKSFNLDSLTVGTTEDNSISRMTISLTSDDQTFEQIKKQLNRSVEVIKVLDFTDTDIRTKEIMFAKISALTHRDLTELNNIIAGFDAMVVEYDAETALIECVQAEDVNNDLVRLFEKSFPCRYEIVRGGSVAVEAVKVPV